MTELHVLITTNKPAAPFFLVHHSQVHVGSPKYQNDDNFKKFLLLSRPAGAGHTLSAQRILPPFFDRVVIIFHLLAVEWSLHAWIAFYGKVNLSTGCKLFHACKYWLAQKMSKLFYANCWRLLTLQHCLMVYFLEKQDILCSTLICFFQVILL